MKKLLLCGFSLTLLFGGCDALDVYETSYIPNGFVATQNPRHAIEKFGNINNQNQISNALISLYQNCGYTIDKLDLNKGIIISTRKQEKKNGYNLNAFSQLATKWIILNGDLKVKLAVDGAYVNYYNNIILGYYPRRERKYMKELKKIFAFDSNKF